MKKRKLKTKLNQAMEQVEYLEKLTKRQADALKQSHIQYRDLRQSYMALNEQFACSRDWVKRLREANWRLLMDQNVDNTGCA